MDMTNLSYGDRYLDNVGLHKWSNREGEGCGKSVICLWIRNLWKCFGPSLKL